jgi:hypothetical protein
MLWGFEIQNLSNAQSFSPLNFLTKKLSGLHAKNPSKTSSKDVYLEKISLKNEMQILAARI